MRRMRPIASICCSPPESLVPWLEPSRSFRFGNSSKIFSSDSPPGLTTRRQQEVFLDAEAGEDAALFRAQRDAGARDLVRHAADQFAALEAHLSRCACVTMPMIDFIVVVLPAPLRPSSVTTSPFAHVEIDAVQNVRLAVPGLQVLDREQRRARRQACPTPI